MTPVRLLVACAVIPLLLAGCGLMPTVEPAPAAVPGGVPEPAGPQPIGPVIELGRGESHGTAWRYSIYESADGLCTLLEVGTGSGAGCGGGVPDGDGAFDTVSSGGTPQGATSVDGLIGPGVAEVVLRLSDGQTQQAALLSLEAAGLEGQAFVGIAPQGTAIVSVVALDADGEVMETVELLR